MKNPWVKKNPLMSLWLSGANTVLGSARGQASAQITREARRATSAWTEACMAPWTHAVGSGDSSGRSAAGKRRPTNKGAAKRRATK